VVRGSIEANQVKLRLEQSWPMNILAVDTSADLCSVALLTGDGEIARDREAGQRHSSMLLPMVEEVLSEAQLTLQQLDGIAYGAGPGSFTGLRIACGVVQGLAFAAELPVYGVSSLLALAEASGAEKVIAALDARMGEIYHAAFTRQDNRWQIVIAANLCKAHAAPLVSGAGWCGVGSGFVAHGAALGERYDGALGSVQAHVVPRARYIARLAQAVFAHGGGVPAHQALPLYVRDKVALTVSEQEGLR
jgi:tRNA threonylcarbamoyladenosine biosynthesis protein TsaB